MALMSHPELLIADEPTTALDATLEVQIIDLLKAAQAERRCSILFISHHLGVIAQLCDRVAVMYAGEVVEAGSTRDIFHDPRHPYTRRLIECDPGRAGTRLRVLPTIPGELPDLAALPGGCVFRDPLRASHAPLRRRSPFAFGVRPRPRRLLLVERTGLSRMTRLLEVTDLRVEFGAVTAVAGVSFRIEAGETYALVGESGSGKTTLIRAVAGLLPSQHGSVRFQGRELRGMSERTFRPLRREMAMTFQDPVGSLSPRLTVGSIVTEPYRIHGMKKQDRDRDAKTPARTGRPHRGLRRPLSLPTLRRTGVPGRSRPERWRWSRSCCLPTSPPPVSTSSVQGELLNLLNDLRRRLGLAMAIITHNLNLVRHVADRMGIMYLGRLVEEGATEAVFAAPRHPYTLCLLSANPRPDPGASLERVALGGEPPSVHDPAEGLRVPSPLARSRRIYAGNPPSGSLQVSMGCAALGRWTENDFQRPGPCTGDHGQGEMIRAYARCSNPRAPCAHRCRDGVNGVPARRHGSSSRSPHTVPDIREETAPAPAPAGEAIAQRARSTPLRLILPRSRRRYLAAARSLSRANLAADMDGAPLLSDIEAAGILHQRA